MELVNANNGWEYNVLNEPWGFDADKKEIMNVVSRANANASIAKSMMFLLDKDFSKASDLTIEVILNYLEMAKQDMERVLEFKQKYN